MTTNEQFGYSFDREAFYGRLPSHDEAAAIALSERPEVRVFYTGRLDPVKLVELIRPSAIEFLVENLNDALGDEVGEAVDGNELEISYEQAGRVAKGLAILLSKEIGEPVPCRIVDVHRHEIERVENER